MELKCIVTRSLSTNSVVAVMIGLKFDDILYIIRCNAINGINGVDGFKAIVMRSKELNGISYNKNIYEDNMIRDMFSSIDLSDNDRIREFVKDCVYYMKDFTIN